MQKFPQELNLTDIKIAPLLVFGFATLTIVKINKEVLDGRGQVFDFCTKYKYFRFATEDKFKV